MVAVFGAGGHTGRFVVEELLRNGITPIAVARDLGSLSAAGLPEDRVLLRQGSVTDLASLDRAFEGAGAVINCAGPFLETADAVASAALRAGIHYIDVSAEQPSTRETLDRYDAAARTAGVAVIPSMSFYGGFADLLTTAAMGDWDCAETIDVMIGLDSWHPTRGTRLTGEKNTSERLVVASGKLVPVPSPRRERDWIFDGTLGQQAMVETPFAEIVLLARHVKMTELHTWLNRIALDDIHNSATPAPEPADDRGRSVQQFIVEVVVVRGGKRRRVVARGRDFYAFSATLVCEAVKRLLDGNFSGAGAQPAGVVFNAREFLSALTPEPLTLEMDADW
jgi:short subunit dehydrogenase-like uncharacterized protein